jgi:hypothetical protein
LPVGFAFGLCAVFLPPAKRWVLFALPVLAATGVVGVRLLSLASESVGALFSVVLIAALVFSLKIGAGFLLALLLGTAVRAIVKSRSSARSDSKVVNTKRRESDA